MRMVLAVLVLMLSTAAALANCAPNRVELRGDFGIARFSVEIADEPGERQRGLMFRENLPRSAGMLFVFPSEQPRSFWMRNVPISLDIIFFDGAGRLLNVQHDAVPFDPTSLPSAGPAQFVLEINGGLARQIGFQAGDVLRHPSLPQDRALWRC